MWRSKKFIIIAVLTVLVVGGTLGGVAIAQADDQNSSQTQAAGTKLLDKVAEIYEQNTGVAIDSAELQKAFTEAGTALKDEALDNYLQKLVADEKITQEQADDFQAWLDARPAIPTDEFKAWMDARPDIPGLFGQNNQNRLGPFGGIQRGFGRFGGGFGDRFEGKFGGWCAPEAGAE
jgi:hypothetical protein